MLTSTFFDSQHGQMMEYLTLVFAFIGAALGLLTFIQNNRMRVKIILDGVNDDARGRNFHIIIRNLSKFGITVNATGFYICSGRQRKLLLHLYYDGLESRHRLESREEIPLTMTFKHHLEQAPDVEQLQDIYVRTVCGKEFKTRISGRIEGLSP